MITGGASGMGRATVEKFVAEGARVVIADLQEDKGRALVANLARRSRTSPPMCAAKTTSKR